MRFREPFALDDSPQGKAMAGQLMSTIGDAIELHERLLSMTSWTSNPSSAFSRLANQLGDAPVELERSLRAAAVIARTSLEMIGKALGEHGTYAVSLAILGRAALIPSGRIIYALGPHNEADQLENCRRVLIQDGMSYTRALDGAAAYQEFVRLRPMEGLIDEARTQLSQVSRGNQPMGEQRMLQRMADVVGDLLASQQPEGAVRVGYREHVNAMFHFYSGFAHGYGWPTLRPQAELVADLGIVGSTGLLALDLLHRRVGS